MADRLFVDSSALVAMLAKESGWETLSDAAAAANKRFTSPIVIFETALALSRLLLIEPRAAEQVIDDLLALKDIEVIVMHAGTAAGAIRAFERFGKGRHPARLNLGDCFSYACARELGSVLLYKGDDFAQTDLGDQGSRA